MTTPRPYRFRGKGKSRTKHRTKETFDLESTLLGLERFIARRHRTNVPEQGHLQPKIINKSATKAMPW